MRQAGALTEPEWSVPKGACVARLSNASRARVGSVAELGCSSQMNGGTGTGYPDRLAERRIPLGAGSSLSRRVDRGESGGLYGKRAAETTR